MKAYSLGLGCTLLSTGVARYPGDLLSAAYYPGAADAPCEPTERAAPSVEEKRWLMETAAKIVIVGGVLNLAYSFVKGFLLAHARRTSPLASKYPVFVHVGPLMQGPMLLGLVFAVTLSPQPTLVKTLADQ